MIKDKALPSCTYIDLPRSSLAENSPLNEHGGYFWSCNFLIQYQLFKQMGEFNERFQYAAIENMDFRVRLRKLKQPFLFVPSASICHPWRTQEIYKSFIVKHTQAIVTYLDIYKEEKKFKLST